MALRVLVTGKPCAGKTTQARALEEMLIARGIKAVDIGGRKRRHDGGDSEKDNPMKVFAESLLSYTSAHLRAGNDVRDADVIISQRLPQDILLGVRAALGRGGIIERACTMAAEVATKFTRHDLALYLDVSTGKLLERFASRKDNRDSMHYRMIRDDDSSYIEMLRRGMGEERVMVIDGDAGKEELRRAIYGKVAEALDGRRRQ